jgi:riboflavin kinase/FMN adenylyltransferase
VWVNNQRFPTITNIGIRPSFAGAERTIEAHLLDFGGDLYRLDLRMEFVERLRPEKRFSDLDDLTKQIQTDAKQAATLLAREPLD